MTTHAPFQQPPPKVAPANIGRYYWIGIAAAVMGFFFSVEITTISSSGGVTECSYTDYGALLMAGLTAAMAVVGLVANPKRHVSERLPGAAAAGLTVLLLAVAALHVLNGTGVTAGPCS